MRTAYKPDSVQRLNLLDDHSSKVCITTNPIAAYPNLTPKQSRRLFKLSYRFLFGIAPGGACHAGLVTKTPVGSYPTLSPLPEKTGGLLSVALSIGLPRPGITRHRCFEESGLSSSILATIQPSAEYGVIVNLMNRQYQRHLQIFALTHNHIHRILP